MKFLLSAICSLILTLAAFVVGSASPASQQAAFVRDKAAQAAAQDFKGMPHRSLAQ